MVLAGGRVNALGNLFQKSGFGSRADGSAARNQFRAAHQFFLQITTFSPVPAGGRLAATIPAAVLTAGTMAMSAAVAKTAFICPHATGEGPPGSTKRCVRSISTTFGSVSSAP